MTRETATERKIMNKTLTGHTSPETAFVVNDYPYGFRLRCKIRYWLEFNPKRGARFWSQTTNPKHAVEVWNKPKSSTFSAFGGAMYLNDEGQCTWTGAHEYMDCAQLVAWRDTYGATMPDDAQKRLSAWIARKLGFEQSKAEGQVTLTMTTNVYSCITSPDFGKPIEPETVETTILKSHYTPNQLLEMGRTLRAPMTQKQLISL